MAPLAIKQRVLNLLNDSSAERFTDPDKIDDALRSSLREILLLPVPDDFITPNIFESDPEVISDAGQELKAEYLRIIGGIVGRYEINKIIGAEQKIQPHNSTIPTRGQPAILVKKGKLFILPIGGFDTEKEKVVFRYVKDPDRPPTEIHPAIEDALVYGAAYILAIDAQENQTASILQKQKERSLQFLFPKPEDDPKNIKEKK